MLYAALDRTLTGILQEDLDWVVATLSLVAAVYCFLLVRLRSRGLVLAFGLLVESLSGFGKLAAREVNYRLSSIHLSLDEKETLYAGCSVLRVVAWLLIVIGLAHLVAIARQQRRQAVPSSDYPPVEELKEPNAPTWRPQESGSRDIRS